MSKTTRSVWAAAGSSAPTGAQVQAVGAARVIGPLAFAFNSAGISDGGGIPTGFEIYTPTVGDVILNCWVRITTAWNGTTPKGFVGTTKHNGDTLLYGSSALDMTSADSGGGDLLANFGVNQDSIAYGIGLANRIVPCLVQAANPICVGVTRDGTVNGLSPGATQGAALLYLVVATPVAS